MFQRGSRIKDSNGSEIDAAYGKFSDGQVCVYDSALDQLRGASNPFTGSWAADDIPLWNSFFFVPIQRSVRSIWAGNQNTTSTTYASIAALDVATKATTVYSFDAYLLYSSSAVGEGAGFQMAFTGTSSSLQYQIDMMTDAATRIPLQTFSTFGSNPASQTAGPGAAVACARIHGGFVSTTAGTLSVQFRAETGGANSVTVSLGSSISVQQST